MFQRCLLFPSSGRHETSVYFCETTWRYKPVENHLHTRCHENVKFSFPTRNEICYRKDDKNSDARSLQGCVCANSKLHNIDWSYLKPILIRNGIRFKIVLWSHLLIFCPLKWTWLPMWYVCMITETGWMVMTSAGQALTPHACPLPTAVWTVLHINVW
jgi:hypothetical protein